MPAVARAEIGSPRGMAQVGSASALGAEGRRFKSGYPDTQAPASAGARQARKATQASLIRCAWPRVNMFMHESWV